MNRKSFQEFFDYFTMKKAAADAIICLLYLLFISCAFAAFSGYSLRAAWMSDLQGIKGSLVDPEVKLNSDIIGLQREHNLMIEVASLEQDLNVHNEKLTENNQKQKYLSTESQDLRGQMEVLGNLLVFELKAVRETLDEGDKGRVDILLAEKFEESLPRLLEVAELLEVVLEKDVSIGPELKKLSKEIFSKFSELEELNRYLAENNEARSSLDHQWPLLEMRLNKAKDELKSIQVDQAISDISRSRFEALSMIGGLHFDILRQLVGFPTIFLTLIVTLSSGGMGALVSMTRSFRKNSLPRTVVWLQLGEGLVAALTIFLLSGTGLIALTSGNSGPATESMSPYTVAFLAFVSGFLADDAFSAIMRSGKKFFEGFSPTE